MIFHVESLHLFGRKIRAYSKPPATSCPCAFVIFCKDPSQKQQKICVHAIHPCHCVSEYWKITPQTLHRAVLSCHGGGNAHTSACKPWFCMDRPAWTPSRKRAQRIRYSNRNKLHRRPRGQPLGIDRGVEAQPGPSARLFSCSLSSRGAAHSQRHHDQTIFAAQTKWKNGPFIEDFNHDLPVKNCDVP